MRIGYRFHNAELLHRSLTHRSFLGRDTGQNNEQFEFLGDAVLSLAMSDLLLKRFPERPEGDLSKIRASLVNETVLASKATELGLEDDLLLGKGEEVGDEPRPVKTIPSHFSRVVEAEENDVARVFGSEGRDSRFFNMGMPLDMETPVCINLNRLAERSVILPRLGGNTQSVRGGGPEFRKGSAFATVS